MSFLCIDYAKAHMAECCLAFASRRIHPGMQYGLLRYTIEDETFISGSNVSPEQLERTMKYVNSIRNDLPKTFGDTLAAHMKRKGITVEQLSENSLISPKTIQRYRNDPCISVSMRRAVGLCIGLKLHPVLSLDLIAKAGLSFNSTPAHDVYLSLFQRLMFIICSEQMVFLQ